MKLESRPFPVKGGYSYEIVNLSDTLEMGDSSFPEHVHTDSSVAANIETAARRGDKWIETFLNSSPAEQRTLQGFTK